jgi:hypothetical protein
MNLLSVGIEAPHRRSIPGPVPTGLCGRHSPISVRSPHTMNIIRPRRVLHEPGSLAPPCAKSGIAFLNSTACGASRPTPGCSDCAGGRSLRRDPSRANSGRRHHGSRRAAAQRSIQPVTGGGEGLELVGASPGVLHFSLTCVACTPFGGLSKIVIDPLHWPAFPFTAQVYILGAIHRVSWRISC